MISDALIPFGLHIETNQLIDVGNVAKGNRCGCICPSCETPLVARQGNEKEWHFAHRSQKVHNETTQECEYSLAVSIRMMIRQLSEKGIKFRTPQYEVVLRYEQKGYGVLKTFTHIVTEEKIVELKDIQIGVNFSGVLVDVVGFVDNVPLVIFVSYKDRRCPMELKSPNPPRCGIISIAVEEISKKFANEKKGQYIETLKNYLQNEVNGKSWVYHARQYRIMELVEKERDAWLASHSLLQKPSGGIIRNFRCLACNHRWSGFSPNCEKCKTHLFASKF